MSGCQPRVYEASQAGAKRFALALALGPLDKADADALRWQVLDHGLEASISHGLDFVGSPRPAR